MGIHFHLPLVVLEQTNYLNLEPLGEVASHYVVIDHLLGLVALG
jgi:hypothetical protein